MKTKIVYLAAGVLLGILITFIPSIYNFFSIPDEIPEVYKDLIPDEATAIRVAESIFDAHYGTEYKLGTEVKADFWEGKNAWFVYYFEPLIDDEYEREFSTAGLPAIELDKDNGTVIRFGLH